ncbi:MAG: OadG family protein [Acidaminococcaceae bacterium]
MKEVTSNPWLIAVINMTIVFAVLYVLGVIMRIIRWVDPTKVKQS